jgi:hypothetical protein
VKVERPAYMRYAKFAAAAIVLGSWFPILTTTDTKQSTTMQSDQKQQAIDLLKRLETNDPKPFVSVSTIRPRWFALTLRKPTRKEPVARRRVA